ncbi:TPA: DUF4888 domain-containing protein [Staphylococcus aureus]|nr:DUF4888 domain-containing protein [Staphylococcus aureus]HDG8588031.1 DUF4888 domain-containing protein [Staphylococcus aureus]HDZ3300858.1 DUF4888 domain-containing protein [Staphylococcus aureus]HDZ3317545.1 DUF4888 domain-containing protein [Staphylococcus aureus]HDZ3341707.1 DUF4888 domain-containing protein [Staphylococcus aureus]
MNAKLLGKTLVASALVLTTLGAGVHSSYLGLDTSKVVKTAKAEENMSKSDLWKGVRSSLLSSNFINGNGYENIKVTYLDKNGQSTNFSSTANHDTFHDESRDYAKLTEIELEKNKNIPPEDYHTTLNANEAWHNITKNLKEKGLVSDGNKVTISTKDSKDPQVIGTVGSEMNDYKEHNLNKRDINKITIE